MSVIDLKYNWRFRNFRKQFSSTLKRFLSDEKKILSNKMYILNKVYMICLNDVFQHFIPLYLTLKRFDIKYTAWLRFFLVNWHPSMYRNTDIDMRTKSKHERTTYRSSKRLTFNNCRLISSPSYNRSNRNISEFEICKNIRLILCKTPTFL